MPSMELLSTQTEPIPSGLFASLSKVSKSPQAAGSGAEISDILDRVSDGDEEAASQLLDYLHPQVMKIVWRRCPDGIPPEDMAQEIYLRVFRSLHQFRRDGKLLHWVSRIAFNTCLSGYAKAEKRRKELLRSDLTEAQAQVVDLISSENTEPDPQQKLASIELLEALLSRLPPKDRMILELRELEQKSFREIAQLTGWSNVSTRVRATRAKKKLKAIWLELLESESS